MNDAALDPPQELRQRLAELESELLALRRLLHAAKEDLPSSSFDVLEVRVGETWYALPIAAIREVLSMFWVEPVPDAPDWVLGTFLYGEQAVALIDLERRLEGSSRGLDPDRIVVLLEEPLLRGFAADAVRDLRRIDASQVAEPAHGIPQAPFLLGTIAAEGTLLHLLSPRRIGREMIFDDSDRA